MNSHLISVVIPSYNRSNVIGKCIQSVITQTYNNLEVIVIDDGSEDDTDKIIEKILKTDNRIRYYHLDKNYGAQYARNYGIGKAKGEWIAFLDSDDVLLVDSLEKRITCALNEKVNVVHSECYVIRKNEDQVLYGVPPLKGLIYKDLLARPAPLFPALLVKKTALEKIGMLDTEILSYQEWDTCLRLAKYYSFGFVENPTFIYDCRDTDTISVDRYRDTKGYQQIVRKHIFSIIKNSGIHTLTNHYQFLSNRYQIANMPLASLKFRFISYIFRRTLFFLKVIKIFPIQQIRKYK